MRKLLKARTNMVLPSNIENAINWRSGQRGSFNIDRNYNETFFFNYRYLKFLGSRMMKDGLENIILTGHNKCEKRQIVTYLTGLCK